MGRTLVKAIADSQGFCACGRLEDARSPLIGWDAGTLAGLGRERHQAHRRRRPAAGASRRHHRFHRAGRDRRHFAALAAKSGKVHIIGTTGLSAADEAAIKDAAKTAVIVKSGNMSLGVNLLAALTRARRQDARQFLRHRNPGDASQPEGRCAVRHRADARPRRRGRPRHRPRQTFGAQPRRQHRRAPCRRYRLCDVARRHRGRRAHA